MITQQTHCPHAGFSITVSDKGWTNGEIGLEWLKDFDERTKEKAKGRPRLLLLDGHNSHFTVNFVEYARANNIHVLCYPAHTTHVLQGLNVVVFAVYKNIWTRNRTTWFELNNRASFGKVAWLEVWTRTFVEAMTKSVICATFRASGVVPLCREVVTTAMMAPSAHHSSHGSLPLPLGSPVKRIMHHHHSFLHRNTPGEPEPPLDPSQDIHMFSSDNDDNSDIIDIGDDREDIVPPAVAARRHHENGSPEPRRARSIVIDPTLLADQQGAAMLEMSMQSSSASVLVSETPMPAAYRLPAHVYGEMPALPPIDLSFLNEPAPANMPADAAGTFEHAKAVVRMYQARERQAVRAIDATNAQLALSGLVVNKSQHQLANSEERKKKKKGFRLKSNGKARLLTHESYQAMLAQEARTKNEKEKEKSHRKVVDVEWKKVKAAYDSEYKAWQKVRDGCKATKQRAPPAPKMPKKSTWMAEQEDQGTLAPAESDGVESSSGSDEDD